MTFYAFLKKQKNRQDPVGDFARDALADSTFPRLVGVRALRRYLAGKNARPLVLRAFERAYAEWLYPI